MKKDVIPLCPPSKKKKKKNFKRPGKIDSARALNMQAYGSEFSFHHPFKIIKSKSGCTTVKFYRLEIVILMALGCQTGSRFSDILQLIELRWERTSDILLQALIALKLCRDLYNTYTSHTNTHTMFQSYMINSVIKKREQ